MIALKAKSHILCQIKYINEGKKVTLPEKIICEFEEYYGIENGKLFPLVWE